jgi:hypothetical protein
MDTGGGGVPAHNNVVEGWRGARGGHCAGGKCRGARARAAAGGALRSLLLIRHGQVGQVHDGQVGQPPQGVLHDGL